MSDRRTISVDPALFSLSSGGTKKRREKKEKSPAGAIKVKAPRQRKQEDTLKKRSILKMIRNHQEDRYSKLFDDHKKEAKTTEETTFNSEFKEAQNFLENLTKQTERKNKEGDKHKNKTLKQPFFNTNTLIQQATYFPTLDSNLVENVSLEFPTETFAINKPASHFPNPSFGCLKNGTLPTYRTYMNKTRKQTDLPINMFSGNQIPSQMMQIPSPMMQIPTPMMQLPISTPINDGIKRINEIKQMETKMRELKQYSKPKQMKQKKTKRRTYKVGRFKHIPKIGVLVSNKTIRNNVTTESQLLKQIPIEEVKKHLVKCGLIKIGSSAPNDVLRKMYESTKMLCGEIQNHNPDTLLHNYVNG